MCNFIVRFPGTKPGVIVLGTHYETNYPLRNINFVGANDGASTTGLLMAIADQLCAPGCRRARKKLDGYSVWLVFFDGEEAIQQWSRSDSTYGSRHLAAKWGRDGTLGQIKAFMLADMIGDKDLDIQRETNSTAWLVRLVAQAAKKFGYQRYFFQQEMDVEDDHLAFVERGVPSIDIIDLDYGPNNSYHHTAQDTMDKISAHSLTIDGDVFMETIRLIDQKIRAQPMKPLAYLLSASLTVISGASRFGVLPRSSAPAYLCRILCEPLVVEANLVQIHDSS